VYAFTWRPRSVGGPIFQPLPDYDNGPQLPPPPPPLGMRAPNAIQSGPSMTPSPAVAILGSVESCYARIFMATDHGPQFRIFSITGPGKWLTASVQLGTDPRGPNARHPREVATGRPLPSNLFGLDEKSLRLGHDEQQRTGSLLSSRRCSEPSRAREQPRSEPRETGILANLSHDLVVRTAAECGDRLFGNHRRRTLCHATEL